MFTLHFPQRCLWAIKNIKRGVYKRNEINEIKGKALGLPSLGEVAPVPSLRYPCNGLDEAPRPIAGARWPEFPVKTQKRWEVGGLEGTLAFV
jgi:hypothetical protein